MNATEFSFEHPRQSTLGAGIHRQRRSSETRYRNRLRVDHEPEVTGVLVSGGLDSSILLKHLLDVGRRVKPFYIRSGLCWQAAEQEALERYLDAVAVRELEPLTVLDLPLATSMATIGASRGATFLGRHAGRGGLSARAQCTLDD